MDRTASKPVIAALVAIAGVTIVPFWSVESLPAVDYPAHLARLDVLTRALAGVAHPHYRVEPRLLPNLAIDLATPPLARLVGVETAFRIVISVIALLPLAGVAMVQRAVFGRVGLGAVLAGAFLVNRVLTFGFYNAAAGFGLALIALAVWIRLADRPGRRWVAMLAASSLVWLCHAFAFFQLGLMVAVWETVAATRGPSPRLGGLLRRWAEILAAFLPGLVGLVLTHESSGAAPVRFDLVGNAVTLLLGVADDGTLAPSPWVLVPVWTLLVVSRKEGRFALDPSGAWVVAAATIAALALPFAVAGGNFVAPRSAALVWFLVAAFSRFSWEAPVERRLAAAAVVVAILQAGIVGHNWRGFDAEATTFRRALAEVAPRGARVLPIRDGTDSEDALRAHLIDFVIVDRDGASPIFFTHSGQQIVRRVPGEETLGAANTYQGDPAPSRILFAADDAFATLPADDRASWPWLAGWSCRFDLVAHLHGAAPSLPADPRLQSARSAPTWDLWRVRPASRCAGAS